MARKKSERTRPVRISPGRIGPWSARHPWLALAVWVTFVVGRVAAGVGLAAAVLIDATVIRSVLLPATMALLGERNWYLPRWLAWLPRLGLEAPTKHEQAAAARPAPTAAPGPR